MNTVVALNGIAGAVLASLLNSLAIGFVIALAAALVMRQSRTLNAATRHAVWWTVFAAVLAIAPVRALVSRLAAPAQPVAYTAPDETEDPGLIPTPGTVPDSIQATPQPPRAGEIDAGYVPLLVVAFGAVVFIAQAARVLVSYRYLRALKRSGAEPCAGLKLNFDEWLIASAVKRPVKLLLSENVDSPIAVGFRRAAVIIPRSMITRLSGDDIDHLLLHELAHLARRDDWTNLIARLASGLAFFCPVAVWVLRRIDEEREIACDDWVVATTGGARRYAISLSRLIEFRLAQAHEILATGIGGRNSQFGDRIERLMKATRFDSRTSIGRIILTGLVLVVLLAAGTQAPAWIAFAQDDPPAPPEVPSAPAAVGSPAAPVAPAAPVRAVDSLSEPDPAPAAPVLAAVAAAPQAPPVPPQPAAAATTRMSFLQALSDAGYRDLAVEELISLKNSGVSAEYLVAMNEAGWGRLTTRQLIELRNHGITPEYLKGIRDAGLKNISVSDAMELATHGVRPDALRQIHGLGFGPYDLKQVIILARHGVRPAFFQALKDAGFGNAEYTEILEARRCGLSATDLREAKKYGAQLTLRQIIRLKQAGVV